MADPIADFFEGLAERGREPRLARATGSIRFDLDDDEHAQQWRVDVRRGVVAVAHAGGPADCSVRTDASLFDDLVSGRANAMAAILRGKVVIDGDPVFLILFQRLFPAPTGREMTASARTVGKRRG
ncbi:MAG: SCP2 sterol-binding domain-containing protein [Chloroflexota bacterium]